MKIFPARFIISNTSDSNHIWAWIDKHIQGSKVKLINPVGLKCQTMQDTNQITCLLETHCTENISTSEFAKILTPSPGFIKSIFFTFE